jgi:hypothetical protein
VASSERTAKVPIFLVCNKKSDRDREKKLKAIHILILILSLPFHVLAEGFLGCDSLSAKQLDVGGPACCYSEDQDQFCYNISESQADSIAEIRIQPRIRDFSNQVKRKYLGKYLFPQVSTDSIKRFRAMKISEFKISFSKHKNGNQYFFFRDSMPTIHLNLEEGKTKSLIECEIDSLNPAWLSCHDFSLIDIKKSKNWSSKIWRLIEDRKVRIGMNKEQAKLSWGEPEKINRTIMKTRISEQWIYSESYLYFDNGILTSIQD